MSAEMIVEGAKTWLQEMDDSFEVELLLELDELIWYRIEEIDLDTATKQVVYVTGSPTSAWGRSTPENLIVSIDRIKAVRGRDNKPMTLELPDGSAFAFQHSDDLEEIE
jgi:hypothetical protein